MGHVVRPFDQMLGGGLQPVAHRAVIALGPKPDSCNEIPPQEDCRLAIGDLFALIDRGGPGNNEQLLPIGINLGHLHRVERIFDRKRVKSELRLQQGHLGRIRRVKSDPVKSSWRQFAARFAIQRQALDSNLSCDVAARCDDHGTVLPKDGGPDNARARRSIAPICTISTSSALNGA